jgi:uncharacterized membrane protein
VIEPGKPSTNARLLGVLAYLGGLVSGVLVLTVERRDPFVRFHAMQCCVTFAVVLVAHLMLRALGGAGVVISVPFVLGVIVLWVVLMVQAWRGRRYHVPYLGAFAEHLLK